MERRIDPNLLVITVLLYVSIISCQPLKPVKPVKPDCPECTVPLMKLSECSRKCRISYHTCKSSARLFSDLYQCYLVEEDCNKGCQLVDGTTSRKTGKIPKRKKKRKHLLRKLTDCKMRNDELSLRVKELEEKLKKKN